jgi:hypothetical protein
MGLNTVKRVFASVRSVINPNVREYGLEGSKAFSGTYMPDSDDRFMFPRYCNETECQSNSASAGLNKWLKTVARADYVMHSFRHSMRDTLLAVNCPADMIDQIGGWGKRSVGEGYGEEFNLYYLNEWIIKLC